LDGLVFDLKIDNKIYTFKSNLLGDFNAINLALAILMANELGMSIEKIESKLLKLESTPHRLQKIESNGKLIIDDSFNGNLEGMSSSYDLVSTYDFRKVIVTPGIVESTKEDNKLLALKIDKIFDIVIITGSLNADILDTNIQKAKKILLKDKSKLQDTLAQYTKKGDLILFSNDAPSFI
jgi:UDP-N-acetylmuramoyl-tripeptide--D-alanyl-D-alanine ligase